MSGSPLFYGNSSPGSSSGASTAGITYIPATTQVFNANGATAGAMFAVGGASAAIGAVYNNNGSTYRVLSTFNGNPYLFTGGNGLGAALSGNTLQLLSGSGSSGIGFATCFPLSTYTWTIATLAPLYLEVSAVAGGGGAGGAIVTAGQTGQPTMFNFVVANGGCPSYGYTSTANNPPVNGGASGMGVATDRYVGSGGGTPSSSASAGFPGFPGGSSWMGGGGAGPNFQAEIGNSAAPNSGGGGGAAGTSTPISGGSGAGGEGFFLLIPSPGATLYYFVGAGGLGGASFAASFPGGAGGSGRIKAVEKYQ